jgi:type II secretory pathway pseudopilin PulG
MKNKKGQSVVEIIFSIGVIAIVIVGVVTLIVNVINVKNESLKRKKAGELSDVIVEGLLEKKKTLPDEFWQLTPITSGPVNGFDGYTVTFTKVTGNNCRSDINDCANAVINIIWDGGKNNLSVTRFFSRRG